MQFTDASTNTPTSWDWDFGDSSVHSNQQNPVHTYSAAGTYTVSLTATNADGSNTRTKTVNPTAPVASFTADKSSGTVPLTVQFTDTSRKSPTSWDWDFGDSSGHSNVQSPEHTYNSVGTYTVSLTATNADGSSAPATATITVNPPAPVASFTTDKSSGVAPLTVQFTDTSRNTPTSWDWDFGDGTTHSNQQNPQHTFSSADTYTVSLTATNAGGSSSVPATATITVSQPAPVASFTANVTSGVVPLCVQFTDTSSNTPTSWDWDFGDGSAHSNEQSPVHTYSAVGPYTVSLTATNSGGSSAPATTAITVNPPAPVASFTANQTTGMAPLCVQFTDTSSNTPTSWDWGFGDGSAHSNEQSPVHTYSSAGTYVVSLTATNAGGSSTPATTQIVVTPYVEAFPGLTNLPRDLTGDGLYQDVNGNGRLDFDDVVTYYQNMDWMRDNAGVGISPFDYNGNGRIDFDDVVTLYQTLLEAV